MRLLPRWFYWLRELALAAVLISTAIFMIDESHTFKECIHNHKNDKEYNGIKDHGISIDKALVRRILRLKLLVSCAVDEKNSSTLVAIFTGLLAFYTFRLWSTTSYLWSATKAAADALPILERAYVFIQINSGVANWIRGIVESEVVLRDKVVVRSGVSRVPIVDYQIINHGKTPAIVQAMSADFTKSAAVEGLKYKEEAMTGEIVIAAGESFPLAADGRHAIITYSGPVTDYRKICRLTESDTSGQKTDVEIDGKIAGELKEGRTFLWFYGNVIYEDIFGETRETRFCWRYDGRSGTFHQYGRTENRRT
jgi:hypothetical protein